MPDLNTNGLSCGQPTQKGLFLFGLLIGLPNFIDLCREAGIYAHLCEFNDAANVTTVKSGCSEQSAMFSNLSALAGVAQNVAFVLVGIIYDRYGTLVTRVITTLSITLGLILVSFATYVNSLLFPGFILWFAGSMSISLTNMQLAQLFPRAQVFIMTWSYAIYLLSGSAFRLWKVMYDNGLTLQMICFINIAYMIVIWLR